MRIKPLRGNLEKFLVEHNLTKKWHKAHKLFVNNIRHPSLHVELLEPHWRGIYSFRLDRSYRALFFIIDGDGEVFQITRHYKR